MANLLSKGRLPEPVKVAGYKEDLQNPCTMACGPQPRACRELRGVGLAKLAAAQGAGGHESGEGRYPLHNEDFKNPCQMEGAA